MRDNSTLTLKIVTRFCAQCGNEFSAQYHPRLKFCSDSCQRKSQFRTVQCAHCGNGFQSLQHNPKYCSRACSGMGRRKRASTLCLACGNPFFQHTAQTKYCSPGCKHVAQTGTPLKLVVRRCDECGSSYKSTPQDKRKWCSKKCADKHQVGRKANPNNQRLYVCLYCQSPFYAKACLRHRKKFCSRQCVGSYTVQKVNTTKISSLEIALYSALNELSITFEAQKRIGYWSVDAYLPEYNLIIEAQGDYWHCNPVVYPDGPKYKSQLKRIAQDKQRFAAFRKRGFVIFELWENAVLKNGAVKLISQYLSEIKGSSLLE